MKLRAQVVGNDGMLPMPVSATGVALTGDSRVIERKFGWVGFDISAHVRINNPRNQKLVLFCLFVCVCVGLYGCMNLCVCSRVRRRHICVGLHTCTHLDVCMGARVDRYASTCASLVCNQLQHPQQTHASHAR